MPYEPPAADGRLKVGLALRQARKAAELTLAEAAELSGVSRSTIGSIERGEHDLASVTGKNMMNLHLAFGLKREAFEDILRPVYSDRVATSIVQPASGHSYSAGARGWKVPKREPTPIPDALLEAAAQYGDNAEFAGIREYRWQRWMADSPHKKRPSTPEEWLGFYMSVKDRFNPKEPEE